MKLTCIIVDDEPVARKVLLEFIEEIEYLEFYRPGRKYFKGYDLASKQSS